MVSNKSIQRVLFGVFFVTLFAGCMQPPLPLPPTITTSSPLSTAIVGEEYAVSLKAAHGEPPLRWWGNPPPTLNLAPISAQTTGNPDRGGPFRFEVAVKDSPRRSETRLFELRITPNVPLAITTDSL